MRVRRRADGKIVILLENDEEVEWMQQMAEDHAKSDEGTEQDQKLLDRLNEVRG